MTYEDGIAEGERLAESHDRLTADACERTLLELAERYEGIQRQTHVLADRLKRLANR